jgi:hypothetical protein
MGFGDRILMNGNHALHVDFVSDKIIYIQGLITFMPERQQDFLSPPQPFGQRQTEEACSIGFGCSTPQGVDRSNVHIRQGQLPIGIAVLTQNSPPQRHGLAVMQQGDGGGGHQNAKDQEC